MRETRVEGTQDMGCFVRAAGHARLQVRLLSFLGMLVVALGLALAGCGYSTTSTSDGGSSTGPITGTTVRPCVGPPAGVGVEGQPTLTLTDATPNRAGTTHVGDLVQVQLSANFHWGLDATPAGLTPTQYVGSLDQARQICFWNFRAQSAGTTTIQLTGTALCESGKPCPMYARLEKFTVQVS